MKKYSLKVSLYRAFASSVLMPFIVISFILLNFFNHQLLNSYNTNNRIILQTLTNQLDSSLQNGEHFFLQYLADTNIAGFINMLITIELMRRRRICMVISDIRSSTEAH